MDDHLSTLAEEAHTFFDLQTKTRDQALGHSRQLTRFCAKAIRAAHRNEFDLAAELLGEARTLADTLGSDLVEFPNLFNAGYTQDALKEYAEASLTLALIQDTELPGAEALGVAIPTYLRGLAEAATELRRRCLDILRKGYSEEAERMLACMDDIYNMLVTMDYPDAVTNGLRRQTDLLRSVLERTRGDLTTSFRQHHLQEAMENLLNRVDHQANSEENKDHPGI